MEDLKRRVRELVPEEKYVELDHVFNSWLAGLKVHTIPNADEEKSGQYSKDEKAGGKVPLKHQVEALKNQIGKFKEKMKVYKESDSNSTELAFQDVKEEIAKVKEEITKLRMKFSFDNADGRQAENTELIQKLDEVKHFLEKLK